ncbi:hypothetical protein ACFQ3P_14500 [Paraburkholderia sabiae]|uniref:Zinc-ribbon domain-containing protein n=1 Tax=Paraburkholderia sabiae TaxID=273251 RepID=A0ABU9Q8D5_9BURK|nr:hypothetical protein [Paraburkholderia sabiae]WJZ77715.1 hypothetical protein QEN71_37355 [Paraburkholderia sabiae]CAD6532973.1 hypothetical protein LMG24235_02690 [Paraburkholderia sabiae]
MVRDCVASIIEAWGGRWLNPDADLQALDLQCARGHIWRFGSAKLKNGLWCPQCSHEQRRSGIDAMQALARRRGGRCVSETYVSSHGKLRWQCRNGHEWTMSPISVQAGNWCAVCLRIEHDRTWLPLMQALALRRGGKCLSDTYVNSRTKLRWQCRHGHIWEATPAGVREAGAWCPVCARARQKLTLADMQATAAERGGHCLSGTYSHVKTKLRWRCAKGHEWERSAARVRNGEWCAICAKHDRQSVALEELRELAIERSGTCLSNTYEGARGRCAGAVSMGMNGMLHPVTSRRASGALSARE